MSLIRNILKTIKNLFTESKKIPKQTQPTTNYEPFHLTQLTRIKKHPLHKYHFGNFTPIRSKNI